MTQKQSGDAERTVDGTVGAGDVFPGLSAALRDGVVARMDVRLGVRDEIDGACRRLLSLHARGIPWRDMLLVAPGKRKWRDRLGLALDTASIPIRMLLGHPGAVPDPADDLVHVVSVYGAEGLAFADVVVMGLGDLPWKQQSLDESQRIVRAAVSAATRSVLVSYSKDSALVERLAGA